MAGTVDTGTGLTITFATSSYAAEITDVGWDGRETPVIDTAHMGTVGARTKRFGDLIDEGSLSVQIHWNPDTPPPIGTEETVTITFPLPSGKTTAATAVGQGGITAMGASFPLEDKMVGDYTMTWTDDVVFVAST